MLVQNIGERLLKAPNPAINADGQKCRFALLLPAGYGER